MQFRMLAAFVAQLRKNSDDSILERRNCIALRYIFYGCWRNVSCFPPANVAASL